MRAPPPIKIPDALAGAPGKPKGETNSYNSGNYNAGTWSILPDSHDGLEITIGCRGHVLLTQHSPFTDESKIVLHPTEAQALHGILPAAIAAANEHRRTL